MRRELVLAFAVACLALAAAHGNHDTALRRGAAGGGKPRCSTHEPTQTEQELDDQDVATWKTEHPGGVRSALRTGGENHVIKVAFHNVIDSQGNGRLSDTEIQESMNVLNAGFAGSGFSFVLKRVRRHRNSKFYNKCSTEKIEKRFKKRKAWRVKKFLNIYTCKPSDGTLGWAWFPNSFKQKDTMHGVVIAYDTVPGGASAPYNEGDTLVHEVGHYLGLYHTFQGGCSVKNDRVDDTPAVAQANYGCPEEGLDSCNDGVPDDFSNYMDYVDDDCMDHFSDGQVDRMHALVDKKKCGLINTCGKRSK